VTGKKVTAVEMVTFSWDRKNGGGRTLFLAMGMGIVISFLFLSPLRRERNKFFRFFKYSSH